jgi:hypothetical protein
MKTSEQAENREDRLASYVSTVKNAVVDMGYSIGAPSKDTFDCEGCVYAIKQTGDSVVSVLCVFMFEVCKYGTAMTFKDEAGLGLEPLIKKMVGSFIGMKSAMEAANIEEAQYRDEGEPGLYIYGDDGSRLVCISSMGAALDMALLAMGGYTFDALLAMGGYKADTLGPSDMDDAKEKAQKALYSMYNRSYTPDEAAVCASKVRTTRQNSGMVADFIIANCKRGMRVVYISEANTSSAGG